VIYNNKNLKIKLFTGNLDVKYKFSESNLFKIIKLVFLLRIDQCVRKDLNSIEILTKIHFLFNLITKVLNVCVRLRVNIMNK